MLFQLICISLAVKYHGWLDRGLETLSLEFKSAIVSKSATDRHTVVPELCIRSHRYSHNYQVCSYTWSVPYTRLYLSHTRLCLHNKTTVWTWELMEGIKKWDSVGAGTTGGGKGVGMRKPSPVLHGEESGNRLYPSVHFHISKQKLYILCTTWRSDFLTWPMVAKKGNCRNI